MRCHEMMMFENRATTQVCLHPLRRTLHILMICTGMLWNNSASRRMYVRPSEIVQGAGVHVRT